MWYLTRMQRWIIPAVLALVLVFSAAIFGYYHLKMQRPAPVWVPLPFQPNISEERQQQLVDKLKADLMNKEVLEKVAHDTDAAKYLDVPSDAKAAEVLLSRMFIKIGGCVGPDGETQGVHIGLNGVRKDAAFTQKVVERIGKDVWGALGIEPPGGGQ